MGLTEFAPVPAVIGGFMIGLAAVFLMATTGRVAGISGTLSSLLPPWANAIDTARLAFVIGLMAAVPIFLLITGTQIEHTLNSNIALIIPAGLLVGFGTVLGSGCTSGHGVCGLACFSPRALAATLTFLTSAIATVFIVRHVLGA